MARKMKNPRTHKGRGFRDWSRSVSEEQQASSRHTATFFLVLLHRGDGCYQEETLNEGPLDNLLHKCLSKYTFNKHKATLSKDKKTKKLDLTSGCV